MRFADAVGVTTACEVFISTQQLLLEDMDICVSKCAPNVVNGIGVTPGASWMPDGASWIHFLQLRVESNGHLF